MITNQREQNIKEIFLTIFILLAIFKTAYIAIIAEIFNLQTKNIAIVTRALILLLGIILLFYQKKKIIHKNYFYICIIFLLSFFVLNFQFLIKLDNVSNMNLLNYKNYFYFFSIGIFILVSISVIFICDQNFNNFINYFFYSLLVIIIFVFAFGFQTNESRLALTNLNPILVGLFSGMLFLISICRFVHSKKKIFSLIAAFISIWVLFDANSRSPIIGLGISLIFFLFFEKRIKFYVKFFYFLILTFIALNYFFFSINSRILSLGIADDNRINIYLDYLQAAQKNIIFPLVNPEYNLIWAHNIFLAIYGSSGFFGLIIFIYLILFTFIASKKLIETGTLYASIGLIFFLTFTVTMFSGALLDEFFWIILSLVNICYYKLKSINNS
jgi:hypothetical protein